MGSRGLCQTNWSPERVVGHVSIAMMIERLKRLGIIDEAQHRRLRINYSTRQWNREEPIDSELEVEQPTYLADAFRLLINERVQTREQFCTGFSPDWIHRLIEVQLGSPSPKPPELKVVEFKKRA